MDFKVRSLSLAGAAEITAERHNDSRGWFPRLFDDQKLSATLGFVNIRHINTSFSKSKGTIRGFHYLKYPANENKFVCLTGSIFDVIVDIRRNSATYGAKHVCRLSDAEPRMLFVPQGLPTAFRH